MKFLCLCHYDEEQFKAFTPAQLKEVQALCEPHDAEFMASGHVVWVGSLAEPPGAKSLKVTRDEPEKVKVLDGTYHASKEPFGAAFMIEAKDMDEAIRIARLHPGTHIGKMCAGGIEIRPFRFFAEGSTEKAA